MYKKRGKEKLSIRFRAEAIRLRHLSRHAVETRDLGGGGGSRHPAAHHSKTITKDNNNNTNHQK